MKKRILTISNLLTIFRFFMGFFIFYYILKHKTLAAFVLFTLALTTDILDGYLARKNKEVTKFGKIVDPIFDKFIYATIIFGVIIREKMIFWLIFFSLIFVAYIVGYFLFLRKKCNVTNTGRTFASFEVIFLYLFIFNYASNFTFTLFFLIILSHFIYYAKKMM